MEIQEKYLTINRWSRPSKRLNKVKGIVVHWVAAPMQKAINTWSWFEKRKSGTRGYGSAHFIVGQEGEVLQCMPLDEMAYHVGSKTYTKDALNNLSSYPNNCTIGIEMAHVDWDGRFGEKTYKTTVNLVAELLNKYNLTIDDIYTHHGVVGWKDCPRWFVSNPDEFKRFKQDVHKELIKGKVVVEMSKYFKDVPKEHWAANTLDKMKEKGLIAGRTDGTFGLGENIKREEVAVLLDRAIDYVIKELK